jgi:hypothetical protein
MARYVRFAEASISQRGPADQAVYVNPDHVRTVRADYERGGGGSIIGMDGYEFPVQQDADSVIGMLSSAQRP